MSPPESLSQTELDLDDLNNYFIKEDIGDFSQTMTFEDEAKSEAKAEPKEEAAAP